MFVMALKVEQKVEKPELMSGDCPLRSVLIAAIKMTNVEYTVDHTRLGKRFGGGRFRRLLIN